MKKRTVIVTIAAALVASLLAGCGNQDSEQRSSRRHRDDTADVQDIRVQEQDDEKGSDLLIADDGDDMVDLDDALELAPWQIAYKSYIEAMQNGYIDESLPYYGYGLDDADGDEDAEYIEELISNLVFDSYYLYDIDKNDIPELIVRFGTCEADYDGQVFTCENGEVVSVGDIPMGHMSLYSYPEENGILLDAAHMGLQWIDRVTMKDGALNSEEIFSEDDVLSADEYTPVGVVIPDSRQICNYNRNATMAIDFYDRIMATEEMDIPVTYVADERVEKLYLDVINGNGEIYGVSMDPFYPSVGATTWDAFMEPGMAEKYADTTCVIKRYTFCDFDGDGNTECIAVIGEEDSMSDDFVVLSLQDDTVYAYLLFYMVDDYVLLQNGNFRCDSEYYNTDDVRVLFDHDQGITYYVKKDTTTAEAEWYTN